MPLNGVSVQLRPPSIPRGPSEVDPVLDIPFQMDDAIVLTQNWDDTFPYLAFQLREIQRVSSGASDTAASGSITINSATSTSAQNSGTIALNTGASSAGNSGSMSLTSGDAAASGSGDITVQTGIKQIGCELGTNVKSILANLFSNRKLLIVLQFVLLSIV